MKITVIKEEFLKAASLVSQVINQRPSLPILSSFLLKGEHGNLQLTATNLETTISQQLPVKVEEEGQVCIPARILVDLCQAAAGERVILDTKKEVTTVRIGSAEASIPTMNPAEFPSQSSFEKEGGLIIDRQTWIRAVSSVAFCASPEGGRPVLSGILLKTEGSNLVLVATDGYRLAKKEMKLKGSLQAIVPARALTEGNKALEAQEDENVEISTDKDKNQLRLETAKLTVTTRLLEGDYPNYEQIMPSSFINQLRCIAKELVDATKLISLFARDVGNVVRIEVEEKNLKVNASTAQVGEAQTTLQVKGEGENIKIAFNSRFLLEALAALQSKEVTISFSGTTSAALLRGPEEETLVYLVMPVRVQS